MAKVRLTAHNARRGKNGVFSPKHNDRNFDLQNAEHISSSKVSENIYLYFGKDDIGECESFEEHELKFYEKHFRNALDKKNENPIKNRQYSRVMKMEHYISSPHSCPEETILQIGKHNDEEKADANTLSKVLDDFIDWHNKTYPQAVFLDAALHNDEPDCAAHIHIRKVWIAHDKYGNERVNQGKSLEEMGVKQPIPNKPKSKYNNPKITYTAACRNKLIEISKSYGFEIEEKPMETSVTGLSKLDNDAKEAEKRRDEANSEKAAVYETIQSLIDNVTNTIVPEKVGLFQKKTDNMVMNKDTYDQVMVACNYIKTASKETLENAKATKTDRAIAAQERANAERSSYQLQLELEALVRKILSEDTENMLNAKKEAEKEIAQFKLLKDNLQQEIKKGIAYGIKKNNEAMVSYLKNHTLSDGRNAYDAFTNDWASKISRRLESNINSSDFINTDKTNENIKKEK